MTALYQIFKRLILPPTFLILLLVVGFAFTFLKFRKMGRVLLAVGIFFLYLLSISPTADLLLTPLESRYTPLNPERLPRTGTLVVLSGGASASDYLPVSSRLSQSSTKRLLEAVRLYHLMDRPQIVISGGSGNPFVQVTESALMRELLLDFGIPGKRIVIEGKSRNTFENGKAIQQLRLTPPIVLITSASHMERAAKVFEILGIHTLPAPCDFRARWSANDPLRFFPSEEALTNSIEAMYAYLNTWWYDLTGKF